MSKTTEEQARMEAFARGQSSVGRRREIAFKGIHKLVKEGRTDVIWDEFHALWLEHDMMERQRAGGKLLLCGDLLDANDAYHKDNQEPGGTDGHK